TAHTAARSPPHPTHVPTPRTQGSRQHIAPSTAPRTSTSPRPVTPATPPGSLLDPPRPGTSPLRAPSRPTLALPGEPATLPPSGDVSSMCPATPSRSPCE